ncbi:MAG: hypothetical protein JWL63_777 [Rhodocyclales bacterium]|nr:hypothetical protein [Rhodocyclales bacterium]
MATQKKKASEKAGGTIRVGIAGWKYAPWRGTFYPKGLVQKRELEFASRALPGIEINSTFYRLQQPTSYAKWYAETPDDFVFSVKAPKLITHERRLHDIEQPVAHFLASGPFELRQKLGPILWQFPPSFKFDPALFEPFLALLPHDTDAAFELAQTHDKDIKHKPFDGPLHRLRHAVEIRNESFVDPAFIQMLRHYNIALVVADTGGRWPEFEDVCADFMYMRLHGADELYASGYSEDALDHWAERIKAWATGKEPRSARRISDVTAPKHAQRDVFCFFDNTMKEKAPLNAIHLLETLGIARTNNFALEA